MRLNLNRKRAAKRRMRSLEREFREYARNAAGKVYVPSFSDQETTAERHVSLPDIAAERGPLLTLGGGHVSDLVCGNTSVRTRGARHPFCALFLCTRGEKTGSRGPNGHTD
jgi:hypothetical protein